MIVDHLLTHGLFYAVIVTGYLFIMMISTSPRVWGYNDYPQSIKDKVPPQTKSEKKSALLVALPWFLFAFGFPIYSTLILKGKLSNNISAWMAFLNLLVLFLFATIGDLVILDWLIVSKITPRFVVIPGSEKQDYKDFSHHLKGHVKSLVVIIPVLLIVATIISFAPSKW
jgi:hypothetical protein